jgi:hypothetical protein
MKTSDRLRATLTLHRRDFLQTLGATGAMALFSTESASARQAEAGQMKASVDLSIQTIAQQNHAMMRQNFLQPETGLFYMYTDAYEPGRINLPTKEQIESDIPNCNGFSTPLENMNLTSSQFLDTLLYRYEITRKPEHAEEVRSIYKGLRHLYAISKSPSFVPRGVLPDSVTHYQDASIDQISFWLMAMWRYYRSPISTYAERRDLGDMFSTFASEAEKNHWTFRREDGLIDFWANIEDTSVPRAPLVFMFLVRAAYDCTGDNHWHDCYLQIVNRNNRQIIDHLRGTRLSSEPSWVSTQSIWLLDCLCRLDDDPEMQEAYRRNMIRIAEQSRSQMEPYAQFDWKRACLDWKFRSLTHRDCLYALISVAMCPDAATMHQYTELAEKVIRHYNYRRDAKVVDLLDTVIRYYWIMVSRGALPYDPALDVPEDGTQTGIPQDVPYYIFDSARAVWYDPLKRQYNACCVAYDSNRRFFYPYDENLRLRAKQTQK